MERQEKIQKIDELRKNVVGFIISKSEAGELVIFSNYYLMIPTNSIHITCYQYDHRDVKRVFLHQADDVEFVDKERDLIYQRFRMRSESIDAPEPNHPHADVFHMLVMINQ